MNSNNNNIPPTNNTNSNPNAQQPNNNNNNNNNERPAAVITQTFDFYIFGEPPGGTATGEQPRIQPVPPNEDGESEGATLYFHIDGTNIQISDRPPPHINLQQAQAAQRQPNDQQQPQPTEEDRPYNLRPRPAANAGPAGLQAMADFERLIRSFVINGGQPPTQQPPSNAPRSRQTAAQMRQQATSGLVSLIFDLLMLGGAAAAGQHFQGQPPASTEAKQNLKSVQQLSVKQQTQCPKCLVCLEEFGSGQLKTEGDDDCVRQMPCKHLFHQQCIYQWLENSNQCPTCRYEIMTDNADYNRSVKERMAQRDAEILLEDQHQKEAEQPGTPIDCPVVDPKPAVAVKAETGRKRKREQNTTATASTTTTQHRYPLRSRQQRPS